MPRPISILCGRLGGSVHKLVRALVAVALAVAVAGPAYAAPPASAELVSQATSKTTGGVSGTVTDQSGAPVAGAKITFRGAVTASTVSDPKGAFQVGSLTAGLYTIDVEKPGYQPAHESDFAVFSGEVEPVKITIAAASFSSLRTIASVTTVGRGTFNTSPASVSTVSAQDFVNQGQTELGPVLNQIPGLQVSLPSNDGNGAAPGAITFANIRNGLAFETATLVDGHPLSVGKYGDYVLSFWTPFMFQSYEVVKGPGADAPQTNFAINGTLNMRTLDPTQAYTPSYVFGVTSTGGTYFNFGLSGTTGRLGFVADIAGVNDGSVINGQQVYIGEQPGGVAYINGTTDVLTYNDSLGVIPGTNGTAANYNIFNLVACCYGVSASIYKLNELLKLRYRFSPSTVATVSYLGAQATADQNGNTSQLTPSTFMPGAGYSGPYAPGTPFLIGNVYPGGDIETNNEPMFQAEISSTIGQDTVLARYYHASIYRLLNEGNSNYLNPVTIPETLNGYNEYGQTYNNVTVPVAWYDYYYQSESDQLGGLDFQYEHPYGQGNSLTFSASKTISTTSYWYQESTTNYNSVTNEFTGVTLDEPDVSIPEGSGETFTTLRLSDNQNFGEKFNAVLTLYDNLYQFTSATTCGAGASSTIANACEISGNNATFQTTNTTHFDERLGLTYRPTSNLVLRAAAGSSIAPPYINLLSRFNTIPSYSTGEATVTINQANPNLVPETAFGYDLGGDYRLKNNYFVSADAYMTNLYNQFLLTTVDSGKTCTTATYPGSNCPAPGSVMPVPPEVWYSIYGNVNNSRYEGIELSIKHLVRKGIGFIAQGSTQRGYAYNLGSNFYCGFGPNAAGKLCTPANYNQNLAVIAGQNFNGGSEMYFHSGSCTNQTNITSSAYWCATGNNVSNQSVPYLQGYAEINWQNGGGWYASFGGTLFGKNNSYNEPPFVVARGSIRAPLSNTLSLQVSGYNLFDAYKQVFPIVSGGVAVPLANGAIGPTNGNVVGPATWTVSLSKTLPY
jgi:outer membrane receptor protein involved in Fe transport